MKLSGQLHALVASPQGKYCLFSTVYEARLTIEPVWVFREKLIIWLCQEAKFFSALQNAGKFMHIHGQ
jgi:hypothetical protein